MKVEESKREALFSFEGVSPEKENPVVKMERKHLYPYRTQQ